MSFFKQLQSQDKTLKQYNEKIIAEGVPRRRIKTERIKKKEKAIKKAQLIFGAPTIPGFTDEKIKESAIKIKESAKSIVGMDKISIKAREGERKQIKAQKTEKLKGFDINNYDFKDPQFNLAVGFSGGITKFKKLPKEKQADILSKYEITRKKQKAFKGEIGRKLKETGTGIPDMLVRSSKFLAKQGRKGIEALGVKGFEKEGLGAIFPESEAIKGVRKGIQKAQEFVTEGAKGVREQGKKEREQLSPIEKQTSTIASFGYDVVEFYLPFAKIKSDKISKLSGALKTAKGTEKTKIATKLADLKKGTTKAEFTPSVLAGTVQAVLQTGREGGDFEDFVKNAAINVAIDTGILAVVRGFKVGAKTGKSGMDKAVKKLAGSKPEVQRQFKQLAKDYQFKNKGSVQLKDLTFGLLGKGKRLKEQELNQTKKQTSGEQTAKTIIEKTNTPESSRIKGSKQAEQIGVPPVRQSDPFDLTFEGGKGKTFARIREFTDDKEIRIKQLLEDDKLGLKVTDKSNPYMAETLLHGKVQSRVEELQDRMVAIDKEALKIGKKKGEGEGKEFVRNEIKNLRNTQADYLEDNQMITTEQADKIRTEIIENKEQTIEKLLEDSYIENKNLILQIEKNNQYKSILNLKRDNEEQLEWLFEEGPLDDIWENKIKAIDKSAIPETKEIERKGKEDLKKRRKAVEKEINEVETQIQKIARSNNLQNHEVKEEINKYLIAKHTKERNAVHYDGAAGMTNAEAILVLKKTKKLLIFKEIKKVSTKIKKLDAQVLDKFEKANLITKRNRRNIETAYKDHISLRRELPRTIGAEDIDNILTKEELPPIISAKGSSLKVNDILENVRYVNQRAEKMIVQKDIYIKIQESAIKRMKGDKTEAFRRLKTAKENPLDVINIIENGKTKQLIIKDPDMAEVFKNQKLPRTKGVIEGTINILEKAPLVGTKWVGNLATTYNPGFWVSNAVKDMYDLFNNVSSELGIIAGAKALKATPGHYKTIFDFTRGIDNPQTRMYKEMIKEGGTTGGYVMANRNLLEKEFKNLTKGNRSVIYKARDLIQKDFIENINRIFEDATRLSAFEQAIKKGKNKKEAAIISKNATVNFNKKGKLGHVGNRLFVFLNASVQGKARFFRAIKKNPKIGAQIIAGFAILALIKERFNEEVDPEWKNKINPWENKSNIVIALGSDQDGTFNAFKIPVSEEFEIIKAMGESFSEIIKGDRGVIESGGDVFGKFVESFDFLGGNDAIQRLTPTALRMFGDEIRNIGWHGGQITPSGGKWDKKPLSERYFSSTGKTPTGKTAIAISSFLSKKFDIESSPENWKYALDQIVGGGGRTSLHISNLAQLPFTAKEDQAPTKELFFINRFLIRRPKEEQEFTKKSWEEQKKEKGWFESFSIFSDPKTQNAIVVRVKDGDTIEVLIDGKLDTVRFGGIDTPETIRKNKDIEFGGIEATMFTKKRLNPGMEIDLIEDLEDRGKYGRLLRVVKLKDGTNFNELMVREGMADRSTYETSINKKLLTAQEQAKKENLGVHKQEGDELEGEALDNQIQAGLKQAESKKKNIHDMTEEELKVFTSLKKGKKQEKIIEKMASEIKKIKKEYGDPSEIEKKLEEYLKSEEIHPNLDRDKYTMTLLKQKYGVKKTGITKQIGTLAKMKDEEMRFYLMNTKISKSGRTKLKGKIRQARNTGEKEMIKVQNKKNIKKEAKTALKSNKWRKKFKELEKEKQSRFLKKMEKDSGLSREEIIQALLSN